MAVRARGTDAPAGRGAGELALVGHTRTSGLPAPADPNDPHVTAVRRLAPAEAALRAVSRRDGSRGSRRRLRARGLDQLYTHQAEAIAHALGGRNVVVVTPTASGKTLCYNAPSCRAILQDPSTRALYLFPTKALAQDQLAELHQMAELVGAAGGGDIGVFTYDGDTPQDARRAIRGRAHVVLSNPDMVHSGILPHHPRWAKLFENLQLRRHRRAARVSRRVRQPPRQHRPAAAARVPALRIRPDVHLFVGDDRQSARTGGATRSARRSSSSSRAARRAARSSSSSSIRRSSTRSSASGARISPKPVAWRSNSSSADSSSSSSRRAGCRRRF